MLLTSIRCDGCLVSYNFPDPSRRLYLYALSYDEKGQMVKGEDLVSIPKKPVWCGVCNRPTFAEDLRTVRDWEGAYSLMKIGETVEYPIPNGHLDNKDSVFPEFKALFSVRQKRSERGRCLCCGGLQYVDIGNPETGLRHEDCGGKFTREYSIFSCLYKSSAYRIYSTDGFQIGRLKQHSHTEGVLLVNECGYE